MIREIYENVVNGNDVRKNLIELKKLLKDENNVMAFLYLVAGDYSILYDLLEDEDAKVRKNVALIMGELAVEIFMDKLYAAYEKEDKLFIKGDYLVALRQFDYRPLLGKLKERLDYLTQNEFEETSLKHINEEKRILTEMLLTMEAAEKHEFNGYEVVSDIVLLTNRDHREVTLDQIKDGIAKVFNAGVIARTKNLQEVLKIRTYSDLLFRLKNLGSVENNPEVAAKAIYEAGLLEFLQERHIGNTPFYFRLEIKTKMPLDKKSAFAKKMAAELESVSNRKLINSTSNYEFEIRLIENKEGAFNILLKLYTIKDERFTYRKHAVAASIQPVNAALIAKLTEKYLMKNAQVLDPFCGVGTMLIERNKLVPANPMYGIDHFGEAIDKAIDNARRDHTVINFINRDFFDFKHDYLFDEIFTNMPTRGGRKTEEEMTLFYYNFFQKALEVLKAEATIIMYTRDKELVLREVLHKKPFRILEEFDISRKEGAYVFVIKVDK